jgi:hypothetical protein
VARKLRARAWSAKDEETPLLDTELWPALPYHDWKDTLQTLHMEMQVIGSVRLALSPPEPQWGHTPLYLTARGLTTGPIPFAGGVFDMDVDFYEHRAAVRTYQGAVATVALDATSVSDFYGKMLKAFKDLGIDVAISARPSEVPNPIPFADDTSHASYDRAAVERFWRVLALIDMVFRKHRARFHGRTSPVQFFWGAFDLALTRFSGEACAPPPNAGIIMRLTCTAVQIAAGFWPGNDQFPEAALYAYAYPKPDGLEQAVVLPDAAFWNKDIGEFLLRYEDVRRSASPTDTIQSFLESTYSAAANLLGWDSGLVAPVEAGD